MNHITITKQDWGKGRVSSRTLLNQVIKATHHGWHLRQAGAYWDD